MTFAQLGRFGVVGAAATGLHFVAGGLLILGDTPPTLANMAAFCIAFGVSFLGHYFFSFAQNGAPMGRAAWRFCLTAGLGFGVNQGLLTALLAHGLAPIAALGLSTLLAAGLVFTASHVWAFKPHKPRRHRRAGMGIGDPNRAAVHLRNRPHQGKPKPVPRR